MGTQPCSANSVALRSPGSERASTTIASGPLRHLAAGALLHGTAFPQGASPAGCRQRRPLVGLVIISSAAFGAPIARAETARRRKSPDARLMHQRNLKQRYFACVCSCEVYSARIPTYAMYALLKKREVPALEGNRYFYVFLVVYALVKSTLRVLYHTLL